MNPWLEIPLEDYEAHMSMPSVAQAQLLSDIIADLTESLKPQSVAIVGCSGGNGLDRISPAVVERVVGVDINPHYIAQVRKRFRARFSRLELFCQDFLDDSCSFEPVELVFAGLVFEYVDVRQGLASIRRFLKPGGLLATVLQLPSDRVAAVSPSPYTSLNKLNGLMKLIPPEDFEHYAAANGYELRQSSMLTLPSGKEFHESLLQFIHDTKEAR